MPVLGHALRNVPVRHVLEHVPKHVPDRHVPEHVLARHVLGLKNIVKIFLKAKTVFSFFQNSVRHSVVRYS